VPSSARYNGAQYVGLVFGAKPVPFFKNRVSASIGGVRYDVTRDSRFLLVNSVLDGPISLTLVTNWDAELKQ